MILKLTSTEEVGNIHTQLAEAVAKEFLNCVSPQLRMVVRMKNTKNILIVFS